MILANFQNVLKLFERGEEITDADFLLGYKVDETEKDDGVMVEKFQQPIEAPPQTNQFCFW